MNKAVRRYRRSIKKKLYCSRAKRQKLVEQFDCTVSCFLEDCPSPTFPQLMDAFGPPEDMARVLMENVSAEERNRYHIVRKTLKIGAILAILLLFLYSIYLYCIKEYSVIVIHDELMPIQTAIVLRGY